MGVVSEPVHELLDILMDDRMMGDVVRPFVQLGPGRQHAVDDQEGDFEKGTVDRQVLDRVAPVTQDAFFPVDVGNAAPAGGGVGECRVVTQQPEIVLGHLDLSKVRGGDRGAVPRIGPVLDRDLVFLAGPVVDDRQRIGHAVRPPEYRMENAQAPGFSRRESNKLTNRGRSVNRYSIPNRPCIYIPWPPLNRRRDRVARPWPL